MNLMILITGIVLFLSTIVAFTKKDFSGGGRLFIGVGLLILAFFAIWASLLKYGLFNGVDPISANLSIILKMSASGLILLGLLAA